MLYGYVRVSTAFEKTKDRNQTFERQYKILTDYGIQKDKIFEDRISGKSGTCDREGFDNLMQVIQKGDTIVVTEMSRFSRSVADLINSINNLHKKGIGIRFLKENLEFGSDELSPMNNLLFQMIAAFNEFERKMIAQRVKEGMASAKARGVVLGRPKLRKKETEDQIVFDYLNGLTYDAIQEKYKISRRTVAELCHPHAKERKELVKLDF